MSMGAGCRHELALMKRGWHSFPSAACTGAKVCFGWRKEVGSLSLRLPMGVGLSNMVAQVVLAVVAKHVEVSLWYNT